MTINVLLVDNPDRVLHEQAVLQDEFSLVDVVGTYDTALDLVRREGDASRDYAVAIVNPTIEGQTYNDSAALIRELKKRRIPVLAADYGYRMEDLLHHLLRIERSDIAEWVGVPYDVDRLCARIRHYASPPEKSLEIDFIEEPM